MVKLWIQTPKKPRFSVDANLSDTVAQLKTKILSASLVPPTGGSELIFVFQGAVIKDSEALSSIKPSLKEEDNIVLLYSKNGQVNSIKPAPDVIQPIATQAPQVPLPDNMQNMIAQITNAFSQSIAPPNSLPPIIPFGAAPIVPTLPQPASTQPPTDPLSLCKEDDVQILLSMGFPEQRCRKALVLNNHDVSAASDWLLEHIADPHVDVPLTASQQRTLLSQQRRVISEVAETANEANVCTFFFTGKNYIGQEYYRCLTCNMREGEGCCIVCARICHNNHNLSPVAFSSSFYCDCGAGPNCTANPTPGQGGSSS